MFDCDGVIFRDKAPTPNVANAIKYLTEVKQIKVLFVTNSSGRSRKTMCIKLSNLLGLQLSEEQMIPSSFTVATYLNEKHC